MADISDVLTALVAQIANAIYPRGAAYPTVAGIPAMVYPGWPIPTTLNTDIAAGKAHISVYPRPEEKVTTRYPVAYGAETINAPTLTAAVTGNAVTIGGKVGILQAVMVLLNGETSAYSYLVKNTDTLTTVAANLAALIPGATANGNVITIPNTHDVVARVITSGTATKETRRQEKLFQVTVWCPDPVSRDSLTKTIDGTLSALSRFELSDGSLARLAYKNTVYNDFLQQATIYRRDLFYNVEYPTTVTDTFYTIGTTRIQLVTPH